MSRSGLPKSAPVRWADLGAESCVVGVGFRCRAGDSVSGCSPGKCEVESSKLRSRRVELVPRSPFPVSEASPLRVSVVSQFVLSQSSVVRQLRPVASVEQVSSRQSVASQACVESVASVVSPSEWRSLGDVVGDVLSGVSPAKRAA